MSFGALFYTLVNGKSLFANFGMLSVAAYNTVKTVLILRPDPR